MLLKFGELALKGRNRPLFVNALERNLRRLTSDLGSLDVRHRGGVLIVTGNVPEDARPPQEALEVDYDPWEGMDVEAWRSEEQERRRQR